MAVDNNQLENTVKDVITFTKATTEKIYQLTKNKQKYEYVAFI